MSASAPFHRTGAIAVLVIALLASLAGPVAAQEPESRLYTWAYYEAWPAPQFGGHGVVAVSWLRSGLPGGAYVELSYNTDTVIVGYRDRRLGDSGLRWGIHLKGQALFGHLLTDYFQRGLQVDERGFRASQVELDTRLAWDLAPFQTLELVLTGRHWFFSRLSATAEALTLPQLRFQVEPRLSWRFWRLEQADRGTAASWFRPFGRVRGFTLGLEVGLDWRDDDTPWGARDPSAFAFPDTRNEPQTLRPTVYQWLVAGAELSPRWSLQVREWAAYRPAADDVSRVLMGGSGPYLVPLAGHPWAAFLSDLQVTAEVAVRVGVGRDATAAATRHELGLVVDAALLRDIERSGSDDLGATLGIGLLAELRFGRWQLETRVGYAPPLDWQAEVPHLTASLGLGTEWLQ